MLLTFKRSYFFLVLSIFSAVLGAQTLYWVGGSGNFNDPKHWSLSSGGTSANLLPGVNNELIVDNFSAQKDFSIKFSGLSRAKSFHVLISTTELNLEGEEFSELHIGQDFILNENTTASFKSKLFFDGSNVKKERGTIDFYGRTINANVTFNNGNWELRSIAIHPSRTIAFNNGSYYLNNTSLKAGSFITTEEPKFYVNLSLIQVTNKFQLSERTKLLNNNAIFDVTRVDDSNYLVSETIDFGTNSKIIGGGNSVAACGVTLSSQALTCAGSNDGIVFVSVDPTCSGIYTLQFIGGCSPPAPTTVAAGGTYTFTNLNGCFLALTAVIIQGGIPQAFSNAVTIGAPGPITFFPFLPIEPTCNGFCNGSFQANWGGGNPPYQIVVVPPGQPQYTVSNAAPGIYSYTSVCAGVHNFSVTDNNGCPGGGTFTLTQPITLTTNISTTSVTCNSFSNGVFAVSPSGGTANYTINFSSGAPQTVGVAGTGSSTGLPAGPISATVTDARGCTLTTSSTILQPITAISFTATQTNVSCNGGSNGSATVVTAGGTPTYAFAWSPSASTSSVASGLGIGPQTVTITDQNSCTRTVAINITQPNSLTLTPNSVNVICSGSTTGAATVTATGGTAPYNFTWTPAVGVNTVFTGVNTTSLGNLSAQNYSVRVLDANGCTSLVVINITQPSPSLSLVLTSQSITCFGANNGSATATPSGGNGAPFTFTWSAGGPPVNASTVLNLPPGTHTITVRDASFCPISRTVSIAEPATFTAAVTTSSLRCNIGNAPCSGSVLATPLGGVAPFTYSLISSGSTLTAGPSTAAASFTGVCSNAYTLNARDASNCPIVATFSIAQPNLLTPQATVPTMSCSNSTVTAVASATGGTSGYGFVWTSPPSTTVAGVNLPISAAGIYTLRVTDSRSCTAQRTVNVTAPQAFTITISTNSISCFNGSNGALSSTVQGGTPGYTFTWSNISGSISTLQNINSLSPGNYTLLVRDINSCTATATGTVLSPTQITTTVITRPVLCNGNSNGTATVIANGGTPGVPSYTYSVNFPVPVTNNTGLFSGQPTGIYTASVVDAAGCLQTATMNIGTPPVLTASITGVLGSCNASSGAATVTAGGGNGAYTYTWLPSGGTSSVAASLAPGLYTVTVRDASLCSQTRTVNVPFIVNISLSLASSSVACNGGSTGNAIVTHTGGVFPFTYAWFAATTPTLTTQAVNTLSADVVYTVRVTDNNLCSNSTTFQLTQPTAISIATTITNVTCFGFSNGSITSTLSGGIGVITPTWNPGGVLSTSISNVPAGNYTLAVRDGNSCRDTVVVNVTEPSSITVTFSNTNPTGCLSNNGTVCASALPLIGGPYTYSLTPPGSSNGTGCFGGLGGGAFTMLVTDAAGCISTSITSLTNPSAPVLTISSTSVACFNASTAVISATAGGTNPFTFSLSPSLGSTITTSPNFTASSLPVGLYFLTAIDNNSCSTTQTVNIVEAASLTLNSAQSNLSCNNINTGSIVVAPSGGTPGSPSYTFSWLPAASITAGQGTGTVSGLGAGNYTLNLTDGNTCLTSYNFTLTQPPAITITANPSNLLCNGVCTGSITSNAIGGTGVLSYSWTAAGGGAMAGSNTPTVTGLCANTGTNVNYSLTITDNNTCAVVNTFTLTEPLAITSTITLLSPSCSNSCNAVATHSVNGGTPTYSYSWSSSAATTSTLGGLCTGNYTGTVTDGNGCSFQNTFAIVPLATLAATLVPVNPLCNNGINGSISSTITGNQGTVNYSWSPSGTGANPSGLAAFPVSVYTLVATDQNSCEITVTTTLTNPPAIVASISGTNPSCSGDSNGMAAVSLTNASGAITFSWEPSSQTTQTASNLSSSVVYTVSIIDGNSCTAQQTITLIDPPAINVTSSVTATSCGAANGSISVNVSGGTPGSPSAYSFTWSPGISGPQGQGTATIVNLFASTYSVTISDGPGCTTLVPFAISNSNGPILPAVVSTTVSCFNGADGSAFLNPVGISGGNPGYSISWGPAPFTNTTNPINGLTAGNYQVRVIDASLCVSFASVSITQPTSLTVISNTVAPLCNGVCDGSIVLSPTGGVVPYTYTWTSSNGGTFPNTASQTSLCAGSYTVVIGHNSICQDTAFYNFINQNLLTVSPSATNNACFGDINGALSLSVSGGNAPYVASWSNSQTGFTITNLANGIYSVVVTDNVGCKDTLVNTITSAPQLSLTTSILQPSCGLSNGSATASASGGSAPFTFTWSTNATTPSISNLTAGIYVVSVNDNSLCGTSQTVIINNSNGITGENINVLQIPCAGTCDGAATVTPIGGNPPYNINWVSPVVSGSVINNLCPGVYFVNMTDAENCARIASISIAPVITLSVSPFIIPPSCGINNGSVNVTVSGGNAPYTYTWTTPSLSTVNTASINGLGAGTYTLMVTESSTNNCTNTQIINLSNPGGPTISSTVTPNPCFNYSLASIQTIGTGTGTIGYSWSNASTASSLSSLTSSVPTVITLTVSSSNGTVSCNTIQSFTLTDPPQLALNAELIQHPTCVGSATCDGSISVQALGGTSPYTYTWSNAASGNTLGALCDGILTLTLTDANNCTITPQSYTLTSLSNISVSATSFSASCSSVPNGSISINFSGGVPNYTVNWQGPGTFTSSNTELNNLFVGDYIYTVNDSLGCLKSDTLSIAPTLTVVAVAGLDTILCPNTGTLSLSGINSSGAESYAWYQLPNNTNTLSAVVDYTVENLVDPTMYLLVVTSSVQSCFDSDTVFINMHELPLVEAGTSTTIPLEATVQIGGNPTGPTAISYTWIPGIYLNNPNIANPVTSNTFNVIFTVTVQDENFCIASDTIRVTILPEIYFTNAFSPNGDQKNDKWVIDYIDQFPGSTVEIYNRWGEQLFSTQDYNAAPFDGKFKGQDLPVGTYYYIIKLKTPNSGIKPFTGPLTIFR